MDEMVMAREKFEKDFDSVVFRSTPKEVFEFLREQEKKRIISLYAGTYSFENAINMCKIDMDATFYFYLNGYNYGYSLRYFQGRLKLERDERIFFKDHKKAYTKKALSNHKTDRKDMRSGEYFANRKSIIKGEISEGLLELIITVVFFWNWFWRFITVQSNRLRFIGRPCRAYRCSGNYFTDSSNIRY